MEILSERRIIAIAAVCFLVLMLFSRGIVTAATTPPDVFISSSSLLQSDALLVKVADEPSPVKGRLGYLPLHFYRSENGKDWAAIVGMHVTKTPGNYWLSINAPGKPTFKKLIRVSRRKFPETKLVVTQDLAQRGYSTKSILHNILTQENKRLNDIFYQYTPFAFSAKPFINPLSEIAITGAFGDIRVSGKSRIQHLGVDLKAPVDTPVYAVNDGKVVFEENLIDYGNTLILDHGLGVYSLYLHLNSFVAQKDQVVKQSDTIALSGSTGYATGPHLHFSIKVRGATLDPLKFIETTALLNQQ